jgi:hypothetical protein
MHAPPARSARSRLRLIRKMRAMSRQCGNMEFFSCCNELVFYDGAHQDAVCSFKPHPACTLCSAQNSGS